MQRIDTDLVDRLLAMADGGCDCVDQGAITEIVAAIHAMERDHLAAVRRAALLEDLLANRHRIDAVDVAAALTDDA